MVTIFPDPSSVGHRPDTGLTLKHLVVPVATASPTVSRGQCSAGRGLTGAGTGTVSVSRGAEACAEPRSGPCRVRTPQGCGTGRLSTAQQRRSRSVGRLLLSAVASACVLPAASPQSACGHARRTWVPPAVSEFRTSFTAVSGHRSHPEPRGGRWAMPQLVVTAVLVEGRSKSEVARDYGVSRRWVITWCSGTWPRARRGCSRGPDGRGSSPRRTAGRGRGRRSSRIRKELDRGGHDAGAETIAFHLEQRHGARPRRSRTIWRILTRPRVRHPAAAQTAQVSSCAGSQAEQPNERWQLDITHWTLADGTEVEILNMLDDHSRLCLSAPTPGPCSRPPTSTAASAAPPPATGIPPPCSPTTARSSPAGPAAAAASRWRSTLHARGITLRPLPALPPADLRQGRTVPPDPQEVARPPDPAPPPCSQLQAPARHLPRLLQHRPAAPRPRPAHPRPGLPGPTQSRPAPAPRRRRATTASATTRSTPAA